MVSKNILERPWQNGYLAVSGGHEIYWEENGNTSGIPILVLHGGPGSGLNDSYKNQFDSDKFRIIGFDQRGCGRSRPLGETSENDIGHLIEDIENLRESLNISAWIVYGGSWGVTLGVAYGEAYPDSCLAFLLRGVFLARSQDTAWWFEGMRRIFPDSWRNFMTGIGLDHSDNTITNHQLLEHVQEGLHNPKCALEFATAWKNFEKSCSSITPASPKLPVDSDVLIAAVTVESHYFKHHCFLSENQLLDNIGHIRLKPAIIIHGRYDIICPFDNAMDLSSSWDHAQLQVLPAAGHALSDPGIQDAVRQGSESLASRVQV